MYTIAIQRNKRIKKNIIIIDIAFDQATITNKSTIQPYGWLFIVVDAFVKKKKQNEEMKTLHKLNTLHHNNIA